MKQSPGGRKKKQHGAIRKPRQGHKGGKARPFRVLKAGDKSSHKGEGGGGNRREKRKSIKIKKKSTSPLRYTSEENKKPQKEENKNTAGLR